ncbi:early light-induced protein chloroplastic-like [Trifolium medium]|uniref:Early light-induced protein chloroplastic-like n=1 Tax=Trifolium medium TaxID=97028 RepID=A0A392MN88_9FABA|nr:early light-induced protein chloroplastic-like [Trifolium medium]
MSTKFSDLMAFSGPAPERINGRLAMIGFVAAMGVEIAKGQELWNGRIAMLGLIALAFTEYVKGTSLV